MTTKDGLLNNIATTAYNVGFGAKKTFATYDLVEKGPGWIGAVSAFVGIFALIFDSLASKFPSALLVCAGVSALYLSFYNSKEYESAARKMIKYFYDLRALYDEVDGGGEVAECLEKLKLIQADFVEISISKQIFISDWIAHYQFFNKMQVEWIVNRLNLTWKDKVPLSARATIYALLIVILVVSIWMYTQPVQMCAALIQAAS